ncbi:MAG: pseudaminic acid synthase [Candidatus Omnitrophota bacterium]|nr:MAG: pseudaminic acid synthase [Candidatus Omnitrophota bacterium]
MFDRVFIVAEISANHAQDFEKAVRMIKKAKACGADAVKFQTYTPDTLTINSNNSFFRIKHPNWKDATLYQLYKRAHTPWEWFKRLKKAADEAGVMFFSTSFDRRAVDLLEELNVPVHKIASFELVDLPLIEYAAATRKPLILSTGMATKAEIKEAVNTAKAAGAAEIVLLKCVSDYPARIEEMNLKTIPHMQKTFKCPVGLSDHTLGTSVPIAAVSLGAVMIEKHLTLSRKLKTPDSFFSIEPGAFKELIKSIRCAEKALGHIHYGLTEGEKKNRIFRRSLFAVKDIKKGERLSEENISSVRPAYGLSPKYARDILGRTAKKDIARGTPLEWKLISSPRLRRKAS